MGLDLFLLEYRRMVLAIWDDYYLQVEATLRQVIDLVVAMVLDRMVEVLGLDLDDWRLVD